MLPLYRCNNIRNIDVLGSRCSTIIEYCNVIASSNQYVIICHTGSTNQMQSTRCTTKKVKGPNQLSCKKKKAAFETGMPVMSYDHFISKLN